MEVLAQLLLAADGVYVCEDAGKQRLHPLIGAAINYLDGQLSVGGQLSEQPGLPAHLEVFSGDETIALIDFDLEFIADAGLHLVAAQSIRGRSKVLFSRTSEGLKPRVNVELTF